MDPSKMDPSPSPTPHPVHVRTSAGPPTSGVSPHDPGAGHQPAHGLDKPVPDAALMHPKDAAHSAAQRNKLAKAQGHTKPAPAGGSG